MFETDAQWDISEQQKMKKSLVMLCVSMFALVMYAGGNSTLPTNVSNSIDAADSYAGVLLAAGDKFIDSVEAQDQNGSTTRHFKIMARELGNGRYYFYAQDKNGTYDILYAERNSYKPFYLYAYGVRWYFASRDLDYYAGTGKTSQW